LHALARLLFAEQDRLPCVPRPSPSDGRIAEVPAAPADRRGRDADAMNPVQPEPGPHRTKVQLAAGVLDQPHRLLGDTVASRARMTRG